VNVAQTLERLVWTAVAAAGAGLIGVPLLGLDVWQAAGLSALAAVVNYVTLVARSRLAVLPDPGDGLPGLRAD
jgi:hypothetical protein